MNNADDRCAMVGCGSVRGSIIHAIGLKSDRSGHHPFVEGPGPYCRLPFGHFEPTPQPASSGDEAKVRDGALVRMANLAWSDIMREKGDIAVVDAVVRDAYATGLRDAALIVEFADLFWHSGDPRTRIATELRKRAADAIARRGSEGK